MSNNLDDLKKVYEDIEIPEDLERFVNKSLKIGRDKMNKKNMKKRWLKVGAVAVLVFAIMTVSINTIPSFANSLISIPGIGDVVRVLQFNDDKATGGEVTDGVDTNFMSIKRKGTSEIITINFNDKNSGNVKETVPKFNVNYIKNPSTMTFTIHGVRALTAEKDFQGLKNGDYVFDIYKNMILDDSAVKFTIVFKTPVKYEVKEYSNPAHIEITLNKDESEKAKTVYSVRTPSWKFGEILGSTEEMLSQEGGIRTVKDNNGTFCVEVGVFNTKEEAEKRVKDLKQKYGEGFNIFIEERNSNDIPRKL